MSSRDIGPNSNAANLDSSDKGGCIFRISSRNATPSFDVKKGIFNTVPQFVQIFIILTLVHSIFARRNNHLHMLSFGKLDDGVAVIATIS